MVTYPIRLIGYVFHGWSISVTDATVLQCVQVGYNYSTAIHGLSQSRMSSLKFELSRSLKSRMLVTTTRHCRTITSLRKLFTY